MLELNPLHPLFGAEVRGFDVRESADGAAFTEIRVAFERDSLLLLRGQDISDEQSAGVRTPALGPWRSHRVRSRVDKLELVRQGNFFSKICVAREQEPGEWWRQCFMAFRDDANSI